MPAESTAGLLLATAEHRTPSTTAVDFDAVIGGNLAPAARELLKFATQQRGLLQEGLTYGDAKVDPRNVAAAVSRYLPSVWRITQSMEASASANVKLNKPLSFSWTSVLSQAKGKGGAPTEWRNGVLVYEVSFVLMVQALAHADVARVLVAGDGSRYAEASTELRKAAGICSYISETLLPRWVSPPKKRPPEVMAEVAKCLSIVYLVQAQRVATAKAIKAGASKSMVAKLLLGACINYDQAARVLRTLPREEFEGLEPSLLDELGTMPALLKAIAYKNLAQLAQGKGKWGEAVALSQQACLRINGLSLGASLEPVLRAHVNQEAEEINALFNECNNDNKSVYFDPVPTSDELELPAPAFIAKPIKWDPPAQPVISFVAVEIFDDDVAAIDAAVAGTALQDDSAPPPAYESVAVQGSSGAGGALQAPPGVDAGVFAALPPDVQADVVAQHGAKQ